MVIGNFVDEMIVASIWIDILNCTVPDDNQLGNMENVNTWSISHLAYGFFHIELSRYAHSGYEDHIIIGNGKIECSFDPVWPGKRIIFTSSRIKIHAL